MVEDELSARGRKLAGLVEAVTVSLETADGAFRSVEPFLAKVTETCRYLKDQLEATAVAQAGLEAILSAYASRYPEGAEEMEDVVRFRAILDEKERKISFLEEELSGQAQEMEAFMADLRQRLDQVNEALAEVEKALLAVKDLREAGAEQLAQDQAKVQAVIDRFWPSTGPAEPVPDQPSPRINLPLEKLHSVVDEVVARLEAGETERRELLGQVLVEVRDQDLRRVLTEKLNPSDMT